ncbi:hypothetical protein EJB05_34350, partial [Eragrostis curvula]
MASLSCFAPRSISSLRCRRSRPAADHACSRLDGPAAPTIAVAPRSYRQQRKLVEASDNCQRDGSEDYTPIKIDFFGFFYSHPMSEASGDPHMANGHGPMAK